MRHEMSLSHPHHSDVGGWQMSPFRSFGFRVQRIDTASSMDEMKRRDNSILLHYRASCIETALSHRYT